MGYKAGTSYITLDKLNQKIIELEKQIQELKKLPADNSKESQQASKKAAEYRNRAKESRDSTDEARDNALKFAKEIQRLLEDIKERNEQISEYDTASFHKYNAISGRCVEVESAVSKAETNLSTLGELYSRIEDLNLSQSIMEQNYSLSQEQFNKAESFYDDAERKYEKFLVQYESVFGNTDSSSSPTPGLVKELEVSYNDIKTRIEVNKLEVDGLKEESLKAVSELRQSSEESFESFLVNTDVSYKQVLKKIEDLLPGAMTAGLAQAYEEKVKIERDDQKKHEKAFTRSIYFLVFISTIPFIFNSYQFFNGIPLVQIIKETPFLIGSALPMYIPILWLAYKSNKSYKLSKRLIEEYTHKGVVSKTFEGLSTQISNVNDKGISEELKIQLLYNIVSANTENPGKLISDYNKSDHPLMDALDKSTQMADAVGKLAKIPGFSALAKKLDLKANQIIDIQEQKIEAVLEDGEKRDAA